MLPLARQARLLGRYRQIAQVLAGHGFGYLLDQLGVLELLSLPRRVILRRPPTPRASVGERLRQAIIELGPTFIKLGQLLSTRPDIIPHDILVELDTLQDTVPAFPTKEAVHLIEHELGQPLGVLFLEFAAAPIAAGSIGQVYAATLHNGTRVVVKVQRPGIAQTINTDLEIISDLAYLAQERNIFRINYDLNELAWEFSASLRDELDFVREGHNAERFRRNFAGNQRVHIPHVYWEQSSGRVLTTERLMGIKINDVAALDAAGVDRPLLARTSLELILDEVFQHGFFHGDPHPGNLFALPGAVVGAIDFGQVVVLDRAMTRQMLLLLVALMNRDNQGVLHALIEMDVLSRYDITPMVRRDLQRFMERYMDRPLNQLSFSELGNDLIVLARRHEMQLPTALAMLIKTLIMAEGTGQLLDPHLDVFGVARPYTQRALLQAFSMPSLLRETGNELRDLGEIMMELPYQVGNTLHRLNDHELVFQTRETELHRVASALLGAASRLALALMLLALLLALGMLALAMTVGGWQGTLPVALAIVGAVLAGVVGLALTAALLRGRDG